MLLSGVAEPVGRDRVAGRASTCASSGATRQKKRESGRVLPPSAEHGDLEGAGDEKAGPPLLLAERWDNARTSPAGGSARSSTAFAHTGTARSLISRLGNPFHAPDWFLEDLPETPLDGELWIGRKAFQRTVGIVRRQDKTDLWKQVRYVAFDAPGVRRGVRGSSRGHSRAYRAVSTTVPDGPRARKSAPALDHLRAELARIEARGRRRAHASPARVAVRSRPVVNALEGQDLPRRRSAGAGTPERCRPAQGPARCIAGGAGQRHAVLSRHRLLRRRARSTAAGRLGHHISLSGAFRRRRAPFPVIRRGSE